MFFKNDIYIYIFFCTFKNFKYIFFEKVLGVDKNLSPFRDTTFSLHRIIQKAKIGGKKRKWTGEFVTYIIQIL